MVAAHIQRGFKGVFTIARKGKFEEWLTEDGLTTLFGWARDGLTETQIAQNMGISLSTLSEWKNRFPKITETLKKGKAPVDIEVENALLKRALGYDYDEVTTEEENIPTHNRDEDGNVIMIRHVRTKTVRRHVAPDTTAQIFWLKNRRPDRWRDKRETSVAVDVEDLAPLAELLQDE